METSFDLQHTAQVRQQWGAERPVRIWIDLSDDPGEIYFSIDLADQGDAELVEMSFSPDQADAIADRLHDCAERIRGQ